MKILSTSLGYGKGMIPASFIRGLPKRLQPYAYTAQGGLDELVSAILHAEESKK